MCVCAKEKPILDCRVKFFILFMLNNNILAKHFDDERIACNYFHCIHKQQPKNRRKIKVKKKIQNYAHLVHNPNRLRLSTFSGLLRASFRML